jgi:uncharacterized protein DUF6665
MTKRNGLDQLEGEILAEKASALGRIATRLQDCLDALERETSVERHRALRAEAKRYYWYLMVQREALGFRNHSELERYYRVPPPLVITRKKQN